MTLVSFVNRAVVVGLVYAATRSVAGGLMSAFGGASTEPARALPLELAAGMVVGLSLGPVAQRLAGTERRRVVALTTVIFLSIAAVMIEGATFAPELVPASTLPPAAFLQLAVAVLTALAITRLFAPRAIARPPGVPQRTRSSWLWRYAVSASTYVVLYFATGALNYALVTRPYYEAHAGGLVVPPVGAVLAVAVLEGALFPLAVLPLLYALHSSRRVSALICGAVLVVLGGIVPLMVVSSLPVFLRVASAWEILFQKFPVGVVAAVLLGPQPDRAFRPSPAGRADERTAASGGS